MNEPTAILTSDWHLRETQPRCRTDNFWRAQWKKVKQISDLQEYYNIPVVHAGDLFHHWKPSPYLLTETIKNIPYDFYTVYGQHDLPNNRMEFYEKSGITTLSEAGIIYAMKEGSWEETPLEPNGNFAGNVSPHMIVLHQFVWDGKNIPWPGCQESTAKGMLEIYKDYSLVLTGDHHKPFEYKTSKQLLVNPGPLTRQSADETFRPRVYLWYEEANVVEPYYLPIDKDAVTREYIDKEEERDHRMEAFISRLNDDWETTVSFEENLKRFMSQNKLRKSVVEIVNKAIDYEQE